MISVLHVFDGSLDGEDRRTRGQLAAGPWTDVRCVSLQLGPGGRARDPVAAAGLVRRASPDVVHAWGSAALATAAMSGAKAIVYSPTTCTGGTRQLLRWVHRWRPLHVISRTAAEQAPLREAVPGARFSVIRPAVVEPATPAAEALRQSLGIAVDDVVMLTVGESTRAADHASAVWATGILNVLDPRFKVLLWGRGPMAESAVKLAGKLRQRDMVRVAEPAGSPAVAWESLVALADVALLTAAGPVATWPVAAVMAGGLPIISTIDRTTRDFVTPSTAKLATDRSPRTLARCVLDVREDTAATAARVAAARTVAADLFSADRLMAAYAAVYREAAGVAPPATHRTTPSRRWSEPAPVSV